MGSYHSKTHVGHRFSLTIVDDFTTATWTHLMGTKDEAIGLIKSFVNMTQTQFSAIIKILRLDNAFEFDSTPYQLHLAR